MSLSAQQLAAQKNLSWVLAEKLARKILTGEYQAGCILPGEMELGERYGVSRTAIREAVKTLTAKGMVLPRPRIGTRVMPQANWNFLDKKLFTLYVSGGGMIEKCVYGKLGTEKETVKPLQFSVSGAVGAQFNATKRVGIYVEPGVAYFFDDGSDVQTIRKENPFNFNIQAGIRLTY